MLTKKVFLFAAIAMFAVSANAARTIASEEPEFVDGCYQISTAAQLYGFAEIVNGTFGNLTDYAGLRDSTACGKLTADIVVNENVLDADGALDERLHQVAEGREHGHHDAQAQPYRQVGHLEEFVKPIVGGIGARNSECDAADDALP